MTREVQFGDGTSGVVSLNTPVLRYPNNPILTAHQVNSVWQEPHLQVMTVHNAGAVPVASAVRDQRPRPGHERRRHLRVGGPSAAGAVPGDQG